MKWASPTTLLESTFKLVTYSNNLTLQLTIILSFDSIISVKQKKKKKKEKISSKLYWTHDDQNTQNSSTF